MTTTLQSVELSFIDSSVAIHAAELSFVNSTIAVHGLSLSGQWVPSAPGLTYPTGGQAFKTGAPVTITWTASIDYDTPTGSLQYHIQWWNPNAGPAAWQDVTALTNPGDTSWPWTTPILPWVPTDQVKIRIRAWDGTNYGDFDEGGTFIIDGNLPVVTITGVSNGAIYGALDIPRTPTVTVTDDFLASEVKTLNGSPYTSGTPISAEDDYTLYAEGTDQSGNTANDTVNFSIDTTPPDITVGGVAQGGSYDPGVAATITVTDDHAITTETITLDGNPYVSGTPIPDFGPHQLYIYAEDEVGNFAESTTNFEVAIAWPSTLPQYPLVRGYNEATPEVVIRTKMDVGPDKIRRRATAGVSPMSMLFSMTVAQVQILDDFFNDTLQGGAITFRFRHPRLETLVDMRFTERPTWTRVGPKNAWEVTTRVEVLP